MEIITLLHWLNAVAMVLLVAPEVPGVLGAENESSCNARCADHTMQRVQPGITNDIVRCQTGTCDSKSPPSPKDTWIPVDSIPSFVSLRGRGREHICGGALIDERHILTAATCLEVLGPNPIAVIGPQSAVDNRNTPGVEEVRVELATVHPLWTGRVQDGYDAVLMRIPRAVHRRMFLLPKAHGPGLYPNTKLEALRMDTELEGAHLSVVDRKLCPHLKMTGKGQFCAYSSVATMKPGSSGGPLLSYDRPVSADGQATLVGIISYANFSALNESGVGCVLVSDILDWIEEVIYQKPPEAQDISVAVGAVVVLFLTVVTARVGPAVSEKVSNRLAIVQFVMLGALAILCSVVAGVDLNILSLAILSITTVFGGLWMHPKEYLPQLQQTHPCQPRTTKRAGGWWPARGADVHKTRNGESWKGALASVGPSNHSGKVGQGNKPGVQRKNKWTGGKMRIVRTAGYSASPREEAPEDIGDSSKHIEEEPKIGGEIAKHVEGGPRAGVETCKRVERQVLKGTKQRNPVDAPEE